MIRSCVSGEIGAVYRIINEAARAYEGVIPADCYHQPYMSLEELEREMERMTFYGWEEEGRLVGLMGFEPVKNVSLIRHAYVLPERQKRGIAGNLLNHIVGLVTTSELLVGTWADAYWAIDFYKKRGFRLRTDKDELLKKYWNIPQRQVDTSVVLGMEISK